METNKIIVKCEVPYLIRTDNPENDEFEFFSIPTGDYTAEIGFRMAPGGGSGNITTAGAADEDRLGHMSTTHVKTKLDKKFLESIPDNVQQLPDSLVFQMGSGGLGEPSYIAEEVTNSINKFLNIYRANTESYWMRNLLPHDIFDFLIVKFDEEGNRSEQHHKHTAGAMTAMGSTLSDEEVSEIQNMLDNQKTSSIYSRLQLKLRDQISLNEYALAVVDSQRLMESWIKEAFEHLLQTVEGYSRTDAKDTARNGGDFKNFHNIRGMYNSKLGFNLESTTEFNDWDNIAKDLRNDIVHEGYEPSRKEAIETVKINNKLMLRVKSEFGNDLHNDLLAISELPDDGIGRTTLGDD